MSIIVFDFDGTLGDSLSLMFEIYEKIADEKGYRKGLKKNWQVVRRMKVTEALKFAGIKPYQVPGIIARGRKELIGRADEIKLFAGVSLLIKQLHADGHKMFVLSSNAQPTVRRVLNNFGIRDEIRVLKSAPVFGKASTLKKIVKKHGDDIWMIGDELRDGQAAKKAKVKFIAVSWGLQPPSILKATKPTAIAKKPSDIAKIINGRHS